MTYFSLQNLESSRACFGLGRHPLVSRKQEAVSGCISLSTSFTNAYAEVKRPFKLFDPKPGDFIGKPPPKRVKPEG